MSVSTAYNWETERRSAPPDACRRLRLQAAGVADLSLYQRGRGRPAPPAQVAGGTPSDDDLRGQRWTLTEEGAAVLYRTEDLGTAQRIGFAPACPGHCLTWEEHLSHVASLPVVPDTPEDEASWEADRGPAPSPEAPLPPAIAVSEDMADLNRLLKAREWKAAVVLGGAFLEGLLVRLLLAHPEKVEAFRARHAGELRLDRPINEWGLFCLIRAAHRCKLIKDKLDELCHAARKIRNDVSHTRGTPARLQVSEHQAMTVADAALQVLKLMGWRR